MKKSLQNIFIPSLSKKHMLCPILYQLVKFY